MVNSLLLLTPQHCPTSRLSIKPAPFVPLPDSDAKTGGQIWFPPPSTPTHFASRTNSKETRPQNQCQSPSLSAAKADFSVPNSPTLILTPSQLPPAPLSLPMAANRERKRTRFIQSSTDTALSQFEQVFVGRSHKHYGVYALGKETMAVLRHEKEDLEKSQAGHKPDKHEHSGFVNSPLINQEITTIEDRSNPTRSHSHNSLGRRRSEMRLKQTAVERPPPPKPETIQLGWTELDETVKFVGRVTNTKYSSTITNYPSGLTTPLPTPSQPPTTPLPTPSQPPTTPLPTPSQPPTTPLPTPSQPPTTPLPTPSQPPTTPLPTPSQPPTTPLPTPSQPPTTPLPTPSQPPTTPLPTPPNHPPHRSPLPPNHPPHRSHSLPTTHHTAPHSLPTTHHTAPHSLPTTHHTAPHSLPAAHHSNPTRRTPPPAPNEWSDIIAECGRTDSRNRWRDIVHVDETPRFRPHDTLSHLHHHHQPSDEINTPIVSHDSSLHTFHTIDEDDRHSNATNTRLEHKHRFMSHSSAIFPNDRIQSMVSFGASRKNSFRSVPAEDEWESVEEGVDLLVYAGLTPGLSVQGLVGVLISPLFSSPYPVTLINLNTHTVVNTLPKNTATPNLEQNQHQLFLSFIRSFDATAANHLLSLDAAQPETLRESDLTSLSTSENERVDLFFTCPQPRLISLSQTPTPSGSPTHFLLTSRPLVHNVLEAALQHLPPPTTPSQSNTCPYSTQTSPDPARIGLSRPAGHQDVPCLIFCLLLIVRNRSSGGVSKPKAIRMVNVFDPAFPFLSFVERHESVLGSAGPDRAQLGKRVSSLYRFVVRAWHSEEEATILLKGGTKNGKWGG
ncbi:hypothetical protein BLNAU_10476 [Blattamonas nauphoetae]|uniref:Uncharacterized protein n=1 Tax=Blattamonas nauphoetae TaxID=2049346 RepID=A0ABQ9XT42_9EUKA|nr:hypothetical protein BLNAU_10476 [Blattamonas nauphoetae]